MFTIVLIATGIFVLVNIFRGTQNARLMESSPGLGERVPWIPVSELREIAAGTRSRPLTRELLDARGPYGWPLFPDHRLGVALVQPDSLVQETTFGWPVATIYHTKPIAPRPGMAWMDWSWSRILSISADGSVTSIELPVFAPILALLLLWVILIQHFAHRVRAARTLLIILAFLAAGVAAFWPGRVVQPEEVSRAAGSGGSQFSMGSLSALRGIPPSTIDLATLKALHNSPTGDRDLATLLVTSIDQAAQEQLTEVRITTPKPTKVMGPWIHPSEEYVEQSHRISVEPAFDPSTMNAVFCLDDPAEQPHPATRLFQRGRLVGTLGGGSFGSASSLSTLWNWPVRILGHGTVDVPADGRAGAAAMGTFFSPQTTRVRWYNSATSTLHVTTFYPRETWPLIGLVLLPGVLFAAVRRHLWTRRRRAWVVAGRCGSCGYSLEGLD